MYLFLSHVLTQDDPCWPGEMRLGIRNCAEIGENSACATALTQLPDHFGTHMDAPAHFNPNGPAIAELPIEYFVHDSVCFVQIPKNTGEGVTAADLRPYEKEIGKASLLLVKTGFGTKRSEDPALYSENGPYLMPDCCRYLIETFGNLHAVGFDFLSVGSPANGLAAESHRILLGYTAGHSGCGRFVCAVEDMKLDALDKAPKRVFLAPLRIRGVDSGQVSVIAEL